MARLYPRFIVVHHTAGHDVPAVEIDRYHQGQGFGLVLKEPLSLVQEYLDRGFTRVKEGVRVSIGYHYLLRADGTVENGRPDFLQGAHCNVNRMNFTSVGVALTGNFDSKDNPTGAKGHMDPTRAQVKSLRELLYFLLDIYKIPEKNVLLHREIAATRCPGDRFKFSL